MPIVHDRRYLGSPTLNKYCHPGLRIRLARVLSAGISAPPHRLGGPDLPKDIFSSVYALRDKFPRDLRAHLSLLIKHSELGSALERRFYLLQSSI